MQNYNQHPLSTTDLLSPHLQRWHIPPTMTSALSFHTPIPGFSPESLLQKTEEEGTGKAGPLLPSGGHSQHEPEKHTILVALTVSILVSHYPFTVLCFPIRRWKVNMINVAEYGQTRKHCDMLLLFLVLHPFLLPFPVFLPLTPSLAFTYFHFSISLSKSWVYT